VSDDHLYTVEQEIADVQVDRPHVIILGAGASLASFPKGDKNGQQLPVMTNLVEVLGLEALLKECGIKHSRGDNFELIYSNLLRSNPLGAAKIEDAIDRYFSELELPDYPTIYDHLVLSLREKDFIATFNWDPFLYQACSRNHRTAAPPRVAYLHGSVAVGYCGTDKRKGKRGGRCSVCGQAFKPTKLLYPVAHKDYHCDTFIQAEWRGLELHLKQAFALTIFGYGAPKSDVEAVALMKNAWGDVAGRDMEQTEIVDVKAEDELSANWKPFIHSHHYEVHDNFHASWVANHPRRSCEAGWQQFFEAKFIDVNPIPAKAGFPELYRWLNPLLEAEKATGS